MTKRSSLFQGHIKRTLVSNKVISLERSLRSRSSELGGLLVEIIKLLSLAKLLDLLKDVMEIRAIVSMRVS